MNTAAVQKEIYREKKTARSAAGRGNRADLIGKALFRTTLAACLVICLLGLALVVVYSQAAYFEYQQALYLSKLEIEKEILKQNTVVFARLTAPDRIKKIATERLGMVVPEECDFIVIKPDGEEGAISRYSSAQLINSETTK